MEKSKKNGAVILQEIRKSNEKSKNLKRIANYAEFSSSSKIRKAQEKEWHKLQFLKGLSKAINSEGGSK